MDKIIGVSELRKSIASIVKEVHEKGSRYIVMQNSRVKAVLLSTEEVETLEAGTERIFHKDIKNTVEDDIKKEPSSYEKFFGKK